MNCSRPVRNQSPPGRARLLNGELAYKKLFGHPVKRELRDATITLETAAKANWQLETAPKWAAARLLST